MRPENLRVFNKLLKKANELYFKNQKQYKEIKVYFPINYHIASLYGDIIFQYSQRFRNTENQLEFSDVIDDLFNIINDVDSISSDLALKTKREEMDIKDYILTHFRFQNDSQVLREVIKILEKHSEETYLVGGCIRDIINEEIPKDYDICTDTPLEVLKEDFENSGFDLKSVGEQFLVGIISKNGETYEIANLRKDKDNSGGEIGSIFEDAQRRDFTCNSVYFRTSDHKIIDINNGIDDISTGTLRFIGNAKDRIKEDPNRVFRAYRFINKGFKPNPSTLRAIRSNFQYAIENTTPERIKNEIERIVNLRGE